MKNEFKFLTQKNDDLNNKLNYYCYYLNSSENKDINLLDINNN